MKQYEFDFSKFTASDAANFSDAANDNDVYRCMQIIDKCVIGGIMNLPLMEVDEVMRQCAAAAREYFVYTNYDDDNVNRLLKQALGGW